MTELSFKGKESIRHYHKSVPVQNVIPDPEKGIGDADLNGNLIIQGDNLVALKALESSYRGKVDCIFIDPPYNTGKEHWCYNDDVNSPVIQKWLKDNNIETDDMDRHDKWCVMMWPRLSLLRELLSENGSLWMTLDEHECHRAKLLLDDIFGEENFIGEIIRKTKSTTNNVRVGLNIQHEVCMIYAKDRKSFSLKGEDKDFSGYTNPDNDPKGPWAHSPITVGEGDLRFPITNPHTGSTFNLKHGCLRFTEKRFHEHIASGRIVWKKHHKEGDKGFIFKKHLCDVKRDNSLVDSLFGADNQYLNGVGTREIISIFGQKVMDYPKPLQFVQKIIEYATGKDALILDSFAGSGTTAHATLAANKKDGGNRRFIVIEMEEHIADAITAERIRKVMTGYEFKGVHRTELLREKMSWSKFYNSDDTRQKIREIELYNEGKFGVIKKTIKEDFIVITGETRVKDKVEGIGGSFTYCTLDDSKDTTDE